MSYRSRGFLAGLFGGGRSGGKAQAAGLFPPRPPASPDAPAQAPARPPAPLPAIAIEPPRPDVPPPPLPEDVPPPAPPPPPGTVIVRERVPQPAAATAEAEAGPEPGAEPASGPMPAAAAASPLLPPVATRPASLASTLETPPPLPLGRRPASPPPPPPGDAVPESFAEYDDLTAGAATVARPGFWGGQLLRLVIAPPAPLRPPLPLLPGTEAFTDASQIDWHGTERPTERPWPSYDVACSFAADAVVTGPGHVWLDGRLVTAPEIMPGYVRDLHRIASEGSRLLGVHALPLREIAPPCVVLVGHGLQVYGHFMIELLFRVLLARRALRGTGLVARWLLDSATPAWLLRVLQQDLRIGPDQIEFFDAAKERVRLRHAVLPGLLHRDEGFHPLANELIEELMENLRPLPAVADVPRLFVARRGFQNPHSAQRECRNEAALVALAEAQGFTPIVAEDLPWRQQLATFRNAEIVVGTFGSGLHTALVAPEGTRVGSIGMLNRTQSEIGALRGHKMGYLTQGFALQGQFAVPEAAFAGFLEALCAGTERRAGAGRQGVLVIDRAAFGRAPVARFTTAPAVAPATAAALLPGTEGFAVAAQRTHHAEPRPAPLRDAACYFTTDIVVGRGGRVALSNAADLPDDLVAPAATTEAEDAATAELPVRRLDMPCAVLTGPIVDNYLGFMTDMLPRILLARRAFQEGGERIRLLLDSTLPRGLQHILRVDLNFVESELERFDPAVERIHVRHAVLPTPLYRDGAFHPAIGELFDDMAGRLALPEVPMARRLFVHRAVPPAAQEAALKNGKPGAPRGDWRNEQALAALAEERYGFVPVPLEGLPWRARLARLRIAREIVVAPGLPLASLLMAGHGTRIGYVGVRNLLAAEIAAGRGQRLAYLTEGTPPKGPFTVPEERFSAFLDALCDPEAEKARAA